MAAETHAFHVARGAPLMNKNVLVISAVALAILGVGTIYAMKSKNVAPVATTETGNTASHVTSSSPDIVVPQGTALAMRLQSTISTKTAQVGDRFQAEVSSPVHVNDHLAIPQGSKVTGH